VLKNRGFCFLEILFSRNYGEFRGYDILVGNNFLNPNHYFGFHLAHTLTEKNRKYRWTDNFGSHCTSETMGSTVALNSGEYINEKTKLLAIYFALTKKFFDCIQSAAQRCVFPF
jgi:hypothetical protein